jgi:hypothetical protein
MRHFIDFKLRNLGGRDRSLFGNTKSRRHLSDLEADENAVLKYFLKK